MKKKTPGKRLATDPMSAIRLALGALDSATPEKEATATTAPIVSKRRRRKAKVATTTAPNYRVIPNDTERVYAPTQPTFGQEERWLKWLVRFVQLDAKMIAAKDWGATFRGFVRFAGKWATPDLDEGLEVDDPAALATALHEGFKSFVENGEWETPAFRSLKLHVRFGETPEVAPIGTVTDVIIFGAAQLLLEHGRRVGRCVAQGCRRVLLAHGRRVYCSIKCRDREKQRLFIESKGGPEGFAKYRSEMRKARLLGAAEKRRIAWQKECEEWQQKRDRRSQTKAKE